MGPDREKDAAYLDACRMKRNVLEYDYAGGATESDADELVAFLEEFRADVLAWLRANHPELL